MMKKTSIVVAAVMTVCCRESAFADSLRSPISISSCRFSVFTVDAFSGDLTQSRLRTLAVAFRNTGSVPVTAVTFTAVNRGERLVVTDKGMFRTGALVKHELTGYSSTIEGDLMGAQSCKVTATQPADGNVKAK
jgi:hypothetical protein